MEPSASSGSCEIEIAKLSPGVNISETGSVSRMGRERLYESPTVPGRLDDHISYHRRP